MCVKLLHVTPGTTILPLVKISNWQTLANLFCLFILICKRFLLLIILQSTVPPNELGTTFAILGFSHLIDHCVFVLDI